MDSGWFVETCDKLWVKQAVLEVEIEAIEHIVLVYRENKLDKFEVKQ